MRRIQAILLALTALALSQSGLAQEERTYDRADFPVTVEREVENDTMIAVVFAEVEDNDQSDAASEVNSLISWAGDLARSTPGIELQTMQYTTRPVYAPNSRRIVGWIARQSLRLESQDSESLSTLLGTLQERVAIESMSYQLSKAVRDAVEDELVAEALARFRQRATQVASEMGRDGYRLMWVNINAVRVASPSVSNTRALSFAAEAAPPQIEAGVQTLSVSANGAIELLP